MGKELMEELQPFLRKLSAMQTALAVMEWDSETEAPAGGAAYTANVQGTLAAEYQRAVLDPECGRLARALLSDPRASVKERGIARLLDKEIREFEKIPPEEYENYNRIQAQAFSVWQKAKRENRFDLFAPHLELLIGYQKKFADLWAKPGQKRYDVLLEKYEEGFTMEVLDPFFRELKERIVPLLRQIQEKPVPDDSFLNRYYPAEKQREFCLWLAEYLGFDLDRGVIGESEHPFTTSFHNHDVRITTHYYENQLDSAIFSLIHETGHALYEQDIDDDLTQTPAGTGSSMGMHESQSRLYENMLGRSLAFWKPVYPKLRETFPEQLTDVSLEQYVSAVNRARAGLIRTEADELTYCLHIMVRYEMEKLIFQEDARVEDLPAIWADKYEEYLGIRPLGYADGILQDVHWAGGNFGYFPSYALGTAFAAQIYHRICQDLPAEQLLEEGRPDEIHRYLKERLHRFGASRTTAELLREVCGEPFDPAYYIRYLEQKFG